MATLTTLASFDGDNGAHPIYGSLVADANGDLFGTTLSGGDTGDGTVFELVHTGSGYTFQTLASLNYTSGSAVFAGLTTDSAGNLFGVAQSGGAAGYGAVFELANTGSGYSLQTLASFSGGASGAYPTGGLVADANGNLFGTTQSGGANSQGSVFELVNTGSGYSLQTLVSFDFNNGAAPTGPLIADSHGNLFGTTLQGGPGNVGTVFELVNTGSGYSLQTLATFHGADGSYLYAGLTADAQGDLFGTTYSGGANGYGTVFELVNTGSGYTFQTLVSLDGATTGGYIMAGVSIDAHGDLFGAALTAGPSGPGGSGTVFELVNTGSGYTFQTVYGFSGSDGSQPKSAPIVDADGNLYGTTAGGGPDGGGTVYEISFGTPGGGGSGEQAALALNINGASSTPVGAAGSTHVGFTVAGMVASDTGTVTFTDQANHTVTVQVIGGQTHYSADFSTLTDGAVTASLQVATNTDGDSFTPVAGNTVTLDTAPPAQPSTPTDAAVTGGYVNAAHDTAAQTIAGTAEAGAGIVIYDNGTQVGAVTADNSGAWSWQAGVLGDGAHSITVTATDLAGNTSAASAALSFTVDTSAAQPAAPADAAVSNGYVNAAHDTAGQTISGVTEAGASVTVYDNGTQVGTTTADGSGAWSYQVGVLGDGTSHSYTVTAADAAGNVSAASAALSFTVDTSAPAKPGAPADASVAGGYVNAAHDTAGQTISGTAEAGASVAVYDNEVQVGAATADGSGAWSYQVGALGDGAHSFTVTATDAAGNTSAASDPLSFTVDASAPAKPGAPSDASVAGGYVNAAHDTAGQTIGGATEAGATVAVYDNGTQVATVTADGSGAWTYQVGALGDGSSHSYTVTATDAAGNTSAASDALSFTVDASAPGKPAAPADASVVGGYVNAANNTAAQTISGTTEAGASVAVYDNGAQVATVTADGAGAWTYQVGVLGAGTSHSYTVTATDAVGNTSAASDALSFTVGGSAPAKPGAPADAAVINGYVNAAHDTAGQAISGVTEAGATVAVYDNGTQVGAATADGSGAWSYQVGVLGDGTSHSYTVTATNGLGDTSPASDALSFTVDASAPAKPGAPADTAVTGGYVNAAHDTAGQTITGAAAAGASVTIYDNGTQVGAVTADGSGAWSYQVGALGDGTSHSYTVTATDAAGNTSAASDALSFTVDTSAPAKPAAPGDAAVGNGYVNAANNTASQTISGTTEAGASVAVYDNGTQVGAATADGSGAWSYQVGVLGGGTNHSYTVITTDAAGNTSAASDSLGFTVDTSAPAKPVAPTDAAASNGYVNAAHDTADQTIGGATEAGASVAIYDNGIRVGTATADGSGAWSYQVGALGDGTSHSYTVAATDAAGNTGAASDALSFTVDTTGPDKPAAPTDAAVSNGYVDAAANTANQMIGGTAEAGASVAVYDNGAQVAMVTADGTGAWSYQVGVLAEGSSHSYAVTATDAAGNTGGASDVLSFTVGASDPPPPPPPLPPPPLPPSPSSPATPAAPSDASVIDGYVNKAHDTPDQTVGGVTEAGATVTLYDRGTQVATVTADDTGAWSYKLGVLANGTTHSFTVTATNAGGTSGMSDALSFAVDTAPPPAPGGLADVSIVQGYVNAAHDTAGQTLTGTAEQGALVTVYDNGTMLGTATADTNTGGWSVQLGVLADGSHTLSAAATDAAGNIGQSSSGLIFKVDTQPPIPVVNAVTDAAKGMSNVVGSAEAGSTVSLFDGGKLVGVTTAGNDGKWNITTKLIGGAVHQFTETAVDLAGNLGSSPGVTYWSNAGGRPLVGGAGNDVLIGQKGDTLTGGAGQDHFVVDVGFGKTAVTDFASGADQIGISHTLADNAATMLAHARASQGDTVISFGNGDFLTLLGVLPSALHAGDFFFI